MKKLLLLITITFTWAAWSFASTTYEILSIDQLEDNLITKVEYSFDGLKVVVPVSHFRPTTVQDIKDGILNRLVSEQVKPVEKINATNKCTDLMAQIETGVVVEV